VEIAVSDSKIRFAFGNVVVTSKLIDGAFPDYQRVIPSGNDKILEVGRQELQEAVDRVATVSTEKSRAVKLNLENGKLTLTVVSPEAGTATEELFVEYRGDPLEIGFNARYLLEILERIEGATARLFFADSGSPTMVREADSDASLFVLMPMRV
jgi:DNA polymerase-3 subunit beta